MDLPWNPAKLEQRIARAWRKNQKRNVTVINLVSEDTIEHRMISLLEQKQALATNVLYEGTIKEMDIPSGRVAFIERLEALMETPPTNILATIKNAAPEETKTTPPPLDIIENHLIAQAPNNLLLINRQKKPDNSETLFIVVEDNDKDQIKKHIQTISDEHDLNQQQNIELLDKQTYETMQRLLNLGIISINPEAEALLNPKTQSDTRRKQQNARIKKSRNLLNQIERKFNMAELLINGDFYQEAIPALKEATEKTLLAYSYANNYCNNIEISLSTVLEKQLSQDNALSNDLLSLCWQPCFSTELNDSEIKSWLSASKELYSFADETLTKLAMS